jgi:hypothetical protein
VNWSVLATVYEALGRLEDARMAQEKAIATDMGGANTENFKSQLKKIQAEIEKRKK